MNMLDTEVRDDQGLIWQKPTINDFISKKKQVYEESVAFQI